MDSCLISAFMLWPMCLAQTTWKPSAWLHGGGMKEHLRWTLWPMSSGVMTGRDGRDGRAAENTDRGGGEDYFIGCNIEKETSRRMSHLCIGRSLLLHLVGRVWAPNLE